MRYLPAVRALMAHDVPVYVHFGTTHRCNLRCKMCGLWKLADKDREMSLTQIKQMARNLASLGTTAISLGGGEPFMRPELPEIVRAFMDQGIEPRVLTNGLIKDPQLLQAVAATGLRHISISLDTLDGELQANICKRDNILEQILEAVRYWAGILRGRHGLGVLNCVVSKLNFRHLPAIVRLAAAYGFYASFVPLEQHAYQERDLDTQEAADGMSFTTQDHPDLEKAYARLLELKKEGQPIFNSTNYLQYSLRYLKGEDLSREGYKCRAGSISFSVSPEGLYSMCHLHQGMGTHDPSIPKVCDPNFANWYRSARPWKLCRNKAASCRACLRPCWHEVNLAFSRPQAFLQAASMRFPHPIPALLPQPQELLERLSGDEN